MAGLDLNEYLILDARVDLDPAVVQGKLEALLTPFEESGREQVDRCYLHAFLAVFDSAVEQRSVRVTYFTEDQRESDFHSAAEPILKVVVNYAGRLGLLVSEGLVDDEAKEAIKEAGERVFCYAKKTDERISADRADLATFFNELNRKRMLMAMGPSRN